MLGFKAKPTEESIARECTTLREDVSPDLRDSADPFIDNLKEVKTLHSVATLNSERDKLSAMATTLERVISAFQAGFDLTTPNAKWYCGSVEDKFVNQDIGVLFPSMNTRHSANVNFLMDVFVFAGIIPVYAQVEYLKAKKIFGGDHIQIYAPQKEYFRAPVLRVDPAMIGMIQDVPDHGNLFFEIARWDTSKDLEAMNETEEQRA